MKTFYITTAIDYPNGRPHMGHAYEKIVTDCYARWHRSLGRPTYFLTGTDENGQKLLESAKAVDKEAKVFVDENVEVFKSLCSKLNISNDDFIRTGEERHIQVCTRLWKELDRRGDIYFGKYSGNYCLSCENFYTPTQAPDGKCPHHRQGLEFKEESGYFFKMGRYGDWITQYIQDNPQFIVSSSARKEVLVRLKQEGVRDVAFSRPNNGWGIPVPGDDKFVMYTWADALVNYYSGVAVQDKERFWPSQAHVIGKDIVWFHGVIWPCMLHALGMPLPEQIYVHGMVLGEDGKKMSKSLGNGVEPFEILEKYPLDSFRYYVLKTIPAQDDGIFSEKELLAKHNNELGDDYGNLIMRVLKLSLKNLDPTVPGTGVKQSLFFENAFVQMEALMRDWQHHKALNILWQKINEVNAYVNESEPWKYKTNPDALKPVIYNCCFALHASSLLLFPFLPHSATKTLQWLGVERGRFEDLRFGEALYRLSMPEVLFKKLEILSA